MFKVKDDELTFCKTMEIAIVTEDAAKIVKKTAHADMALPSGIPGVHPRTKVYIGPQQQFRSVRGVVG